MLILVKELKDNKNPECFLIRSLRSVSKQKWDGAFAILSMEGFSTKHVKVYKVSKTKLTGHVFDWQREYA